MYRGPSNESLRKAGNIGVPRDFGGLGSVTSEDRRIIREENEKEKQNIISWVLDIVIKEDLANENIVQFINEMDLDGLKHLREKMENSKKIRHTINTIEKHY